MHDPHLNLSYIDGQLNDELSDELLGKQIKIVFFEKLSLPILSAIIVSLAFHFILLIMLIIYNEEHELFEFESDGMNKTINIKLITRLSQNDNTTQQDKDHKEQAVLNKKNTDILKSSSFKDTIVEKESVKQSKPKTTEKKTNQKNLINSSQEPKEFVLQDFYDNIEKYIEPVITQKSTHNFNSHPQNIQKQINAINQKKEEQKTIKELNQFRKDNELYDFNSNGFSKIVRASGNCFIVQEKDPFAIVQADWVPIGDCSKKKKIEFKVSPLSYKYKEVLEKNASRTKPNFDIP